MGGRVDAAFAGPEGNAPDLTQTGHPAERILLSVSNTAQARREATDDYHETGSN
jgi:hypothetical protein